MQPPVLLWLHPGDGVCKESVLPLPLPLPSPPLPPLPLSQSRSPQGPSSSGQALQGSPRQAQPWLLSTQVERLVNVQCRI